MFLNCSSLNNLKIEFNTEKVRLMEYMFDSCIELKELDIRTFNTQACQSFDGMFDNCDGLELYLNEKNCSNLIEQLPSNVNYHPVGTNL